MTKYRNRIRYRRAITRGSIPMADFALEIAAALSAQLQHEGLCPCRNGAPLTQCTCRRPPELRGPRSMRKGDKRDA
jgi:hypothetical protein